MRKKTLKAMALLLAVLLMTASMLTGCGGAANNPAEKSSQAGTEAASAEKAKEPVTLSILGPTFEKAFPNGIQTDEIMAEIVKKTGVTLDWTVGNGISDFNTYQSTLLATGDMPDIIFTATADAAFRGKIFAANAALPLDDLLASNGQNISKNAPEMIKINKALKSNDSKLYFISTGCNDTLKIPLSYPGTPMIRWDLYKGVGKPPITNEAELLNAFKLMKEKYPANDAGKKAYPLSGFFGDSWGYLLPEIPFEQPRGLCNMNCIFYYDFKDSSRIIGGFSPESPFIQAMKFYNKAYQMGILDPDSFTMKFEQYLDKVKAGRVYFGLANWTASDVYNPEAIAAGKKDSGFAPIWFLYGSPQEPKGYMFVNAPGGAWDYWINKNCKNPDRAVDFFDYLFSYEGTELALNGIQGKHWDLVGGKPQLLADVLKSESNDPNYRVTSGVGKYGPLAGLAGTAADDKGNSVNFRTSIEAKIPVLTDFEKSYATENGERIPGESFMTSMKDTLDCTLQSSVAVSDSEELNLIFNKINTHIIENYPKLLSCKTDAEFDTKYKEFVDEANAIGYQKLLDGYVANFKAAAEKLK